MHKLSIVIPTYNRLDTLRHVIPSLIEQTLDRGVYDIIVADSNSNDGTAEYLAQIAREHPFVQHRPGAYTGRAMARNAGIEAARGEVVLFTDADIIASRDLLERHLAQHDARENIAVVGMELQVKTYDEYVHLRDDTNARRPLHPEKRKRLSWLYFLTGNASVRKRDLDRVGRFDEAFTGYGHEDLELGYRLQKAGVELVYEPRAVDYHWHPVPYAEQKGKMELAGRSTVRFYRKHPAFGVMANLGMTPVSLALHGALERLPALRANLERAAGGEDEPRGYRRFARQVVYQYHYVSGVKSALRNG